MYFFRGADLILSSGTLGPALGARGPVFRARAPCSERGLPCSGSGARARGWCFFRRLGNLFISTGNFIFSDIMPDFGVRNVGAPCPESGGGAPGARFSDVPVRGKEDCPPAKKVSVARKRNRSPERIRMSRVELVGFGSE